MRRDKWIWLVWVVVLLCYLLPYTLLRDVQAWYGSFLLWGLAGLVVIAINAYITTGYLGKENKPGSDDQRKHGS